MTSMLDNPKYGSNFGMELQGGADMLFKTKFKIKPKLILQDPIQYTQYSHNEIFDTGTTNFCNNKHTINNE